MDLAAAVCTARAPACPVCPVRAWCRSRDVAMALPRASQRPADPPVPATNRWLRGRLLAWLRDAPTGTWVESPTVLGEHGPERIGSALEALAADGFVEIDGSRARLRA